MFALVQLDIPNTLVDGPKTPADIAKVLPPTANIDWLARLLAAAHAMGMLNCRLPASSHKAHTGELVSLRVSFSHHLQAGRLMCTAAMSYFCLFPQSTECGS